MTFEIFGVVSLEKKGNRTGNSVVGVILMRLTDPFVEGMHHSRIHRAMLSNIPNDIGAGLLLNFQA